MFYFFLFTSTELFIDDKYVATGCHVRYIYRKICKDCGITLLFRKNVTFNKKSFNKFPIFLLLVLVDVEVEKRTQEIFTYKFNFPFIFFLSHNPYVKHRANGTSSVMSVYKQRVLPWMSCLSVITKNIPCSSSFNWKLAKNRSENIILPA